jgi:tyrosyl-tRNA synthetase
MQNEMSFEKLESELLSPVEDLRSLTAEEQYEIILDKASDQHPTPIVPGEDDIHSLLFKLRESKETGVPLKIKFGIDPTGKDIHIGHAVSLLMLRRFQKMGHQIQLVIGDFTAKIGDASGRISDRKMLTDQQIQENLKTYLAQAGKVVDLESKAVSHHYNSEWLSNMSMVEWIEIGQTIGAFSLIEREDFQNRKRNGGFVSLSEALYPLFMAWDSVVLQPDIELGGVDQYLNLLYCRELMAYAKKSPRWESMAQKNPEIFVVIDLLPGTTGQTDEDGRFSKMSKSLDNYIRLMEDPGEMFGKTMSIPDEVMWLWFRSLTEISSKDLKWLQNAVQSGGVHPAKAKRLLAKAVVASFNHYDREVIDSAEKVFDSITGHQKRVVKSDIETVTAPAAIKEALSLAFSERTRSELRRLIEQKGIYLVRENGTEELVTPEMFVSGSFSGETVVRIGRKMVKIVSE